MSSREATSEESCGQEMAAAAEVPRRWQELMEHVAANMESHAAWVGADSAPARQEHDALLRVAAEYRAMARAAARAATAMDAMQVLPPAPHAPAGFDRAGQTAWMRAKIVMQRELARLLTLHADQSEGALSEMERAAP